ncbi:MAG TPA: Ppx/GppA phosphatase family protein [Candidatus Binataceae bacterium]|nr:Ppx/GppA phosphatase family protein [Candidatus Binataceae bacterium]
MKIGALDVGTNTVLMLVAETAADGGARRVIDLCRVTRLGQGVDHNHRLDPPAALRTLDTIAEFVEQARAAGAEKIVTAGTATLRDAADGESFIRRVRERTGVELEIVSGEAEAWLSYLAVMRGLHLDPAKRLLIIDIGGGSTEFIRAQPGAKLQMASLQIGSVRLTERILHHDPPTAREAADLRLAIDAELTGLGWKLATDVLVGIAGTVTTVCAVALQTEPYDPDRVHGYSLSRKEVERVLGLFGSMPLVERRGLKGLDPARADVIFAGAAILERVMCEAEVSSVTVSDQGVRWGLVWRELGGALAEPPPKPS